MARALIVGCGCHGRELARTLVEHGHAVRGTTRRESRIEAIEATGADAALADPDRLATLLPQIEGISLLFWLMGTAAGEPDAIGAIHGARLESLLEALVDTPVRGFVYEAAGSVDRRWLEQGTSIARRAAAAHRMRVEILTRHPVPHDLWLRAARQATERLLGAPLAAGRP